MSVPAERAFSVFGDMKNEEIEVLVTHDKLYENLPSIIEFIGSTRLSDQPTEAHRNLNLYDYDIFKKLLTIITLLRTNANNILSINENEPFPTFENLLSKIEYWAAKYKDHDKKTRLLFSTEIEFEIDLEDEPASVKKTPPKRG